MIALLPLLLLPAWEAAAAEKKTAAPAAGSEQAREAAARGAMDKALAIAMEGARRQPPDRELFLYAAELLPERKSSDAAALAAAARKALETHKDDFAWHLGLCKALRVSGRQAEAAASCRQALELEPGAYPPYRELGLAYAALGRRDKAEEILEQGAALPAAGFQARYYLGRAREEAGKYAEARATYEGARLLADGDKSLDAHYYKALIAGGLRRAGRKAGEARAAAPRRKPENPAKLYPPCLAKFRQQVQADTLLDAAETAARCRKLDGRDPALAAELAPVLARLEKPASAAGEYERAAALSAGKAAEPVLRAKAAETWLQLGDGRRALEQYLLCVKADPGDHVCQRGLAQALDGAARHKEALAAYEALLKLEPGNEAARRRAEELKALIISPAEALAELRLRRAADEKKVLALPEDMKLYRAMRAAELDGAVDYLRENAPTTRGLLAERPLADGRTLYVLTDAGYKAYLQLLTREAVSYFERQKMDFREIFKLRDRLGRPVFDPSGRLTEEGIAVWNLARGGEKAWLLSYEPVPESPKAVQAARDLSEYQKQGYAEISEPEYLWLLRFSNCPEDVMFGEDLRMKRVDDGARARYLLCSLPGAPCLNTINRALPEAVERYRDGNDEIQTQGTSNAFFGTGGTRRYRLCEDGRIWGDAPPPVEPGGAPAKARN